MSIEVMELFDIFAGTFGKEKAQLAVKDIETLISDHKRELATKEDIQTTKEALGKDIQITKEALGKDIQITREVLAKDIQTTKEDIQTTKEVLAKDIQKVDTRLSEVELRLTKEIEQIRSSVIKWVAGLLVAQTGVIITLILLK